ncbi:MAG: O-antigen ligase family protein [Zoogloeaceae bacterium]|jgi:hypothetical protein|nr:O-antigen ligase family protein [Zoogloeaceae bacterium]
MNINSETMLEHARSFWIRLQPLALIWATIGFLIYLTGFFFLKSSKHMVFFYAMVILPALFLTARSRILIQLDAKAIISLLLFLGYFSASALWGSGEFKEALKFGFCLFFLMLSIEACSCRLRPEFIPYFVATIGGFAVCFYGSILILSDTAFATFAADRFAFFNAGGLGNDNPIDSAIILGLPVLAAWWLFPGRKWLIQIALITLMISCCILMFITKSRGPIVALCVMLLIITFFRRNRSDFTLLFFGILFITSSLLFENTASIVADRIEQPDYRLYIWCQAFEQFKDHWIIGRGFGNNARIFITDTHAVSHAHSSIFETFRVGGITGAILFFTMLFFMLKRSIFHPNGTFLLIWMSYGLLCLLTNGRLLLIKPTAIEVFSFWIPLFLAHFYTRHKSNIDCQWQLKKRFPSDL